MIEMSIANGFGKPFMPTKQLPGVRRLESPEEFSETRLEAIGFIFHGTISPANGKTHPGRSGANLLHFARCAKLEKASGNDTKIWFRSVRVALKHLDEMLGHTHWKWCKVCEREITQRILDET
jgi:hypothetical protein